MNSRPHTLRAGPGLLALLAVTAIALDAASAGAQDGVYGAAQTRIFDLRTKDGSLRVEPGYHYRAMYDTNIFLESDDSSADFVQFHEPSVGAELRTKVVQARLFYEAVLREYATHDDRDVTEHLAEGFLKVKLEPFFVRASVDWQRRYAPIENVAIPLAKSRTRSQSVAFGYDAKEWGVEVEYDRLSYDLEKSLLDFFDHTSQTVTVRGVHKCSDTVTGIAEVTYGGTDFEQSVKNANDIGQGLLGVIWRPSKKVSFTGRVGWRWVDYEGEFGRPFNGDFNGPVFSAVLGWTPTNVDKVRIGARRTVSESLLSNFIDTISFDISYSRKLMRHWWLTPFIGYADINESTDEALQDHKNFKTAGFTTTYDVFKGTTLEMGYTYRRKTTNDLGGEFADQQTFIGARVRF